MKEILRTKNGTNPYELFTPCQDVSNGYKLTALLNEKGGMIFDEETGKPILKPLMKLDGNAYRRWLFNEYPDAYIDIERLEASSSKEVVKVTIYEEVDGKKICMGYGEAKEDDEQDFGQLATAITLGIKNAMRNGGFGVDLDYTKVLEGTPSVILTEEGENPTLDIGFKFIQEGAVKVSSEMLKEVSVKKKEPVTIKLNLEKKVDTKEAVTENKVEEIKVSEEEAPEPKEPAKEVSEPEVIIEENTDAEANTLDNSQDASEKEGDIINAVKEVIGDAELTITDSQGEVLFSISNDAPKQVVDIINRENLTGRKVSELKKDAKAKNILLAISKQQHFKDYFDQKVWEAIQ